MKYSQQEQLNRKKTCLSLAVIAFLSVMGCLGAGHAQEVSEIITLEEAYLSALKSHERIMIAGQEIEKSRLLPKKAMSVMIPHVYFHGNYIRMDDEITHTTQTHVTAEPYIDQDIIVGPTPAIPKQQWIGNLEVKQAIYKPSFLPIREAAFHTIDRSVEDYYQTIQGILFDVAQVYYQIVKAKEMLQNASEILNLAKEDLRVSQVKFAAGKVTEDAVLSSELGVTKAERNVIEANNNLRLAKDTLDRLTGTEMLEFDVVKPPTFPVRTNNYESLVSEAFEHRYDYKVAGLNVKLAEDDVKVAKTKFHPSLDAAWNYFWVDEETYALDNRFWSATVTLNVPIFEGSLRIWDVKEKLTTLRQAKLALENLKKSIQLEVEHAMLTVQTYESILSNLRKQVEFAQKNYEIVFVQFKFGSATALDLKLALGTLSTAKTELTTNTYDYQTAILKIEKAIGLFAKDYIRNAT